MQFSADEPEAGPWRVVPLRDVLDLLVPPAARLVGRIPIVAVDGRSASGKTTFAAKLAGVVPGACVVHTDDIAWWHSRFGWDDLMISGVLEPVRAGYAVDYRPPAWDERGREGSVVVPASATLLIIEGVGAGRRELAPFLDAAVYTQADLAVRAQRELVREQAGENTRSGIAAWMEEENPFVAERRPWELANLIVCSTPTMPYDADSEAVVAPPIRR